MFSSQYCLQKVMLVRNFLILEKLQDAASDECVVDNEDQHLKLGHTELLSVVYKVLSLLICRR